ncbi:hypothetical protein ACJJIP_13830 [Microbulbifer sp. VTAC004]
MNIDFYKNGQFHNNEYDVSWNYTVCENSKRYKCIVTSTPFLVFSVPKIPLSKGDKWEFSGYRFEVLSENGGAGEKLYFIESKATDDLKRKLTGSKSSFSLQRTVFLYSLAEGLVSFNKYFDSATESWTIIKP